MTVAELMKELEKYDSDLPVHLNTGVELALFSVSLESFYNDAKCVVLYGD